MRSSYNGDVTYEVCVGGSKTAITTVRSTITPKRVRITDGGEEVQVGKPSETMTTAQEIELKAAEARPKIEALAIGVATMLRDLAALRKDAERYRWLLAHAVSENDEGEKCIYYRCDFEHYDNVSASIDKAKESQ